MIIGIEHEFVFRDRSGRYLDSENSEYSLFSQIVDAFPFHEGDEDWLECKSLERVPKRCYVEGFEVHAQDGRVLETLPKGLEIRTLPYDTPAAVVTEFTDSYRQMTRLAEKSGLYPVLTSRHPFRSADAPLSFRADVEGRVRTRAELALAVRAMMTHGLHITFSDAKRSRDDMEDALRKLNHYLPFLIPYSFSSPFYRGKVFEGLCSRNYFRAGTRQMASLENRLGNLVMEFRGFDAIGDARLLLAIVTLFGGFLRDRTLNGRAENQDPELLKLVSLNGFDDPFVHSQGVQVLSAAKAALGQQGEILDLLETLLQSGDSYAARMKTEYARTRDLMACISNQYDY